MQKFGMFAAAVVAQAFILTSLPAFAGPGNHLDWGQELTASETSCPPGNQVLKVVRKVTNSVDSGTGLNDYGKIWWATADYVQHIAVVETAPGEFCATVKSQGSFESVGGAGPGNGGDLAPGVVGTFQGGWTNTFKGDFTNPGGMRTKGSIGTFDPACDSSLSSPCGQPVFSKYLGDYFENVTDFALPWWGWVYHAGNNGSWVNAASGNEGDILGE